jgi:GntR family transcriptional repressor for pyruvate dehydrogenase complex
VPKLSIAEDVAQQIAAAIIEGAYERNSRIGTKDEIQLRYGIARGTVNEVIRTLSVRQLIAARPGPNGGIFAATPTPLLKFGSLVLKLAHNANLAKECLELKDVLDPWVAAEASRHRTDADIKKLEKILKDLEQFDDLKRRVATNWKLHRTIAEISPNRLLKIFYHTIMDLLEGELLTVSKQSVSGKGSDGRARYELHRKLVQAIRDGNVALAWQLGGEKHKFVTDVLPTAPTERSLKPRGAKKRASS